MIHFIKQNSCILAFFKKDLNCSPLPNAICVYIELSAAQRPTIDTKVILSLVPTAWLQTIFGLGESFCCHLGGGGGGRKKLHIFGGIGKKNGNSVSNFHTPPPLINNERFLRPY